LRIFNFCVAYFAAGPLVPKIKKQRRAVMNIAPEAVASKAAAAAAAEAAVPVKTVGKPKAAKVAKISAIQEAANAQARASAEAEAANPTNAISAVSYVLMSAKRGKSNTKSVKASRGAAIATSASVGSTAAEVLTVDAALPAAKPSRKRKPLALQGVAALPSVAGALSPTQPLSTPAVRATRTKPSMALPLPKSPMLPIAAPSAVADEPRPTKRARVRVSSRAL
jgi:hypothetical protein